MEIISKANEQKKQQLDTDQSGNQISTQQENIKLVPVNPYIMMHGNTKIKKLCVCVWMDGLIWIGL